MNREKLESFLEKNPFAKLSDVVTQILYDEIVVLDIPPTSKLNINQIATDLGISRTPVVEAINRLQAIGFVETRPKASGFLCHRHEPAGHDRPLRRAHGNRVRSRRPLRGQGQPRGHRQLDSLATEFKKAVPRMDGKRLKETDMPFHKLIVEYSGNKYLIRSYNELLPNLTMYQGSWPKFISPDQSNPWSSQVVHQHWGHSLLHQAAHPRPREADHGGAHQIQSELRRLFRQHGRPILDSQALLGKEVSKENVTQ